jgi:hypothetical protein
VNDVTVIPKRLLEACLEELFRSGAHPRAAIAGVVGNQ